MVINGNKVWEKFVTDISCFLTRILCVYTMLNFITCHSSCYCGHDPLGSHADKKKIKLPRDDNGGNCFNVIQTRSFHTFSFSVLISNFSKLIFLTQDVFVILTAIYSIFYLWRFPSIRFKTLNVCLLISISESVRMNWNKYFCK